MTCISKIYNELNETDMVLNQLERKRAVVFGSARFNKEHKYYKLSVEVGTTLSKHEYDIITGGGPGVMEAAMAGNILLWHGTDNIALNIELDFEQTPNPYATHSINYESFLSRKYGFFKNTDIFVVMPGGFGTLDELFEVLTLMQCSKLKRVPIVLMDRDYYQPLVVYIKEMLLKSGCISPEDMLLFTVIDTVEELEVLL